MTASADGRTRSARCARAAGSSRCASASCAATTPRCARSTTSTRRSCTASRCGSIGDTRAAEDVSQDVFVALLGTSRRPSIPSGAALRTWLGTLTHRRAVDHVRREEARRRRAEREASRAVTRARRRGDGDRAASPPSRCAPRSICCPPISARAIQLAYFGGNTYREVAETLGIPEGTAKSRLRLALRRDRRRRSRPKEVSGERAASNSATPRRRPCSARTRSTRASRRKPRRVEAVLARRPDLAARRTELSAARVDRGDRGDGTLPRACGPTSVAAADRRQGTADPVVDLYLSLVRTSRSCDRRAARSTPLERGHGQRPGRARPGRARGRTGEPARAEPRRADDRRRRRGGDRGPHAQVWCRALRPTSTSPTRSSCGATRSRPTGAWAVARPRRATAIWRGLRSHPATTRCW